MQREDPRSLLHLYRDLIARRSGLPSGFRLLDAPADQITFERGQEVITVPVKAG
jgi:hypothetical protein